MFVHGVIHKEKGGEACVIGRKKVIHKLTEGEFVNNLERRRQRKSGVSSFCLLNDCPNREGDFDAFFTEPSGQGFDEFVL